MSKGHRTQVKRERNEKNVDKRPSATLMNARVSARKAAYVLEAKMQKLLQVQLLTVQDMLLN